MFTGLMNLQAALRFRSADHALLIDGTSPTLATAQLAQKPMNGRVFCQRPLSGGTLEILKTRQARAMRRRE